MSESRKQRRHRGVFERPKGSGIWWVRYGDEHGHERRRKVGSKRLAIEFYRKVKNEVFERRHFPERFRRRDVLLADAIRDHLDRNASRLRALPDWHLIGRYWTEAPGPRDQR